MDVAGIGLSQLLVRRSLASQVEKYKLVLSLKVRSVSSLFRLVLIARRTG
jgi:hypothetical protein